MSQEFISSSLFHFTEDMAVYKLILSNGLRLSYSYESLSDKDGYLIPMICFCDIPLTCLGTHRRIYGKLGIGFSKDYLRKDAKFSNLINPLLYGTSTEINRAILQFRDSYDFLQKKCTDFSMDYIDSLMTGKNVKENGVAVDMSFNLWLNTRLLVGYWKPYEDTNGTYYQEREWRIIVPYNTLEFPWHHQNGNPSSEYRKGLSNTTFNDNVKAYLTVPLSDFCHIDYLVVNSCQKKTELNNFLLSTPTLFGNTLSENDMKYRQMLIEKIIIKR